MTAQISHLFSKGTRESRVECILHGLAKGYCALKRVTTTDGEEAFVMIPDPTLFPDLGISQVLEEDMKFLIENELIEYFPLQ